MRLIHLTEANGQIRVEFSGCNMKCPYCVHIHQPATVHSIEEVIDFVKKSSAGKVYLGGAEPTLQKDLLPLTEELHALGKHILLKSNGMKPEVLEAALPYVDGFVLEIKAPLDDISGTVELTGMSGERTVRYMDLLRKSLAIATGKWLRVWIRVIPEYVNKETMPRILSEIKGADEVMLYQFMSNPEFDMPFKGYDSPVPTWGELEELAQIVLDKIPRVMLVGEKGKFVLEK